MDRKRKSRSSHTPSTTPKDYIKLQHDLAAHREELLAQGNAIRTSLAELEKSRVELLDLYDNAPVGYLSLTGSGIIQRLNHAAASMLGHGAAYLVGMPFARFMPEKDRQEFQRFLEQSFAAQEVMSTTIGLASAEPLFARLLSTPRQTSGTGQSWLRVIMIDDTKRKLAEDQLRESEARYRMLHESLRDPFVQVAMDGRIIDCNDLYCAMLGYGCEEMKTLTYKDVTPEHWHAFEEGILREQILPHSYSDVYEKEYRRKDGQVIPVELRTVLACDEEGQPNAMWAIVRDISERKRLEAALKESEERFRIMADSTPVMIWVTNAQGKIELVNAAYKTFFGVTEEQVRGPNGWQPLVHPEDSGRYVEAFFQALREQRAFDAEARVRNAAGRWRWIHSYGAPRFTADGRFFGLVGSSPDITERVVIEERLRQREQNLAMMVEKAFEPVMMVNTHGVIECVSKIGAGLLGYEVGELVGKSVEEMLERGSRLQVQMQLDDLQRNAPQPANATLRVKTKDGTHRWVSVEASLAHVGNLSEQCIVKFQLLDIPHQ